MNTAIMYEKMPSLGTFNFFMFHVYFLIIKTRAGNMIVLSFVDKKFEKRYIQEDVVDDDYNVQDVDDNVEDADDNVEDADDNVEDADDNVEDADDNVEDADDTVEDADDEFLKPPNLYHFVAVKRPHTCTQPFNQGP
jgi:hypothetical protein